jgi:hypothetical protein
MAKDISDKKTKTFADLLKTTDNQKQYIPTQPPHTSEKDSTKTFLDALSSEMTRTTDRTKPPGINDVVELRNSMCKREAKPLSDEDSDDEGHTQKKCKIEVHCTEKSPELSINSIQSGSIEVELKTSTGSTPEVHKYDDTIIQQVHTPPKIETAKLYLYKLKHSLVVEEENLKRFDTIADSELKLCCERLSWLHRVEVNLPGDVV